MASKPSGPASFHEDDEPGQSSQMEKIKLQIELTRVTTENMESRARTRIAVAVVGLWIICVMTWLYLIVTGVDAAAVNGVGGVAGAVSVATGFIWGHYYAGDPRDPRR